VGHFTYRTRSASARDSAHSFVESTSFFSAGVSLAETVDVENGNNSFSGVVEEPEIPADGEMTYICDEFDGCIDDYMDFKYVSNSDADGSNDSDSDESSLQNLLRGWVATYSVSFVSLSALLSILRQHIPDLPKDPRTLMGTPRDACTDIKCVSKGSYYHFGVESGIKSMLESSQYERVEGGNIVSMQINIDGIPLFKSTGGQFWPILGKLALPFASEPFVIGIFSGVNKPGNLNFLTDLVAECKSLMQSGIAHINHLFQFSIHSVICDAPARSFIKNVKGHASYSACERCMVSGVWNGKMTFPDINAVKRSDVAFDEMQDADHHKGQSPLSELGIGMVSQFVIDYMHLVCLGVVRRLIWLWMSGPVNVQTRLRAKSVSDISECLICFQKFIPVEFARKPRSLVHWQRWKATEFRQFLLYTGPVALMGKVSNAVYNNFMLLSVGMFLLLNKNFACKAEYVDYAEELLQLFVKHFADLYGTNMLVYNVHNIIHLADDARKYGALDSVSAFCFENFLGKMIRLVRKPNRPLQQVIRRLWEQRQYRNTCERTSVRSGPAAEHCSVNIPVGIGHCRQYKQLYVSGVLLSVQNGDNCITVGTDIVLIKNIIVKDSEIMLVYMKFFHVMDFFDYPVKSSHIGIHYVSDLSSELSVFRNFSEFYIKNVMLPYNNGFVVIPLIHF